MYHFYKKENLYLRRALYEAYGKKCVYCGEWLKPKDMQVDHILAVNAVGSYDSDFGQYLTELQANGFDVEKPDYIENYILCCAKCNLDKRNKNFTVASLRYYHEMAIEKTDRILRLIEKYRNGGNADDFEVNQEDSLQYLEPKLKKYVLRKFEEYKAQDIAVRTPQLLRMLLEYEDRSIIDIFNGYEMNDGNRYGDFLRDFFKEIDEKYETEGQTYREEDWVSFQYLLDKTEKSLREEGNENYITVNILCYAILNYREGATTKMIQNQLGSDQFKQLKKYILENRIPSF